MKWLLAGALVGLIVLLLHRLLEGHGDRLDLDPALDPHRDHRPALARTRRSMS